MFGSLASSPVLSLATAPNVEGGRRLRPARGFARDTPFPIRGTTLLVPSDVSRLVLARASNVRKGDYASEDSYDGDEDGAWEGMSSSRNRSATVIRTAGRDDSTSNGLPEASPPDIVAGFVGAESKSPKVPNSSEVGVIDEALLAAAGVADGTAPNAANPSSSRGGADAALSKSPNSWVGAAGPAGVGGGCFGAVVSSAKSSQSSFTAARSASAIWSNTERLAFVLAAISPPPTSGGGIDASSIINIGPCGSAQLATPPALALLPIAAT